jgi:phosphatidylserine decarboxylase
VKRYNVDMAEAHQTDPMAFENFIDFFTRELKAGARPLPVDSSTPVCPADGAINQLGPITEGRLLQAKGRHFSLTQLLGGDEQSSSAFNSGCFMTVYLSPRDYHRVHMPLTGTLTAMTYIPGKLFSVNNTTAEHVPGLFARNERVVCLFDTERGPMAMVLVGAMIVAGVETVWAGEVCPGNRKAFSVHYPQDAPQVTLQRGEEMGRFKLGSTVIVLFGPDAVALKESLKAGDTVRMGEAITD